MSAVEHSILYEPTPSWDVTGSTRNLGFFHLAMRNRGCEIGESQIGESEQCQVRSFSSRLPDYQIARLPDFVTVAASGCRGWPAAWRRAIRCPYARGPSSS